MPDHPTEQVDRVARAIAKADHQPWDEISGYAQSHFLGLACAALDAATPERFDCDRCGVNVAYHSAACIAAQIDGRVGSVGERDQ